jgi:glycosyltransferase involved in cell wall biosynthesis
MNGRCTLVVPCYNEASRLDAEAFLAFADSRESAPALLFVDDGSRDETRMILTGLCSRSPGRISLLALDRNQGKAEAVRTGLRAALAAGASMVGYMDADLSTSTPEMQRLIDLYHASGTEVLMGARVSLLGREVRRQPARHYLGRIFASAASWVLKLPVYDTQCGAKLFKSTPALESALQRPFLSSWAFDVELLGRLLVGDGSGNRLAPDRILEEPLRAWRHKPGSKLSAWHMLRAGLDMVRIARVMARERQASVKQSAGFSSPAWH